MTEPHSERRATGRPHALLEALALVLLGALLYLPSIGATELDDEEGRRAVPAREMLASGDWVLPTVYGRTYLNKPPLYFWAVAGAARLTGSAEDGAAGGAVDETATRLPSALATIATALLLAGFARRHFAQRAGLVTGALFLCTFSAFEKGAFGELEALLACATTAACLALWSGRPALAGLALGAALLTKGPPALAFVGAAAVASLLLRRTDATPRRPAGVVGVLVALGIGAGLASLWLVLLFQRPEAQDVIDQWGREVARSDGSPWASYLEDRVDFLTGVATGLLPGLLVWLLALGTPSRARLRAQPVFRAVELATLLALLVFFFAPGTNARYAYPAVPLAVLASGALLAEGLGGDDERFLRRLGRSLRGLAVLAALVVGAAGWLAAGELAGLEGLRGPGALLALGLLVLVPLAWSRAGALLGGPATGGRRTAAGALTLGLAILVGFRELQLLEVTPRTALKRGRAATARELERFVEPGERLHATSFALTNELYYLDREVELVAGPGELEDGDLVVCEASWLANREEWSEAPDALGTIEAYGGRVHAVLRWGSPAADSSDVRPVPAASPLPSDSGD